ncbi:anaphase-promoting complex subunit cdh1-like [Panonychus citri]|uniref:anaphase-promoting complex subunit cdh1-like n=1 Tax=Panonychus citri TaxID=50023 RepID=UPI0023079BF7|nr:anaphase-promoting complex subunit cdh1-like [Panonychus citri]
MVINGEAEIVGPSPIPRARKNWTSFEKDETINPSNKTLSTDVTYDSSVATLEPSATLQINREKDSPSRVNGGKGFPSSSSLSSGGSFNESKIVPQPQPLSSSSSTSSPIVATSFLGSTQSTANSSSSPSTTSSTTTTTTSTITNSSSPIRVNNNNLKQVSLDIEDSPNNKAHPGSLSSVTNQPSTSSPSSTISNNDNQPASGMQTIPLKQMSRSPSKSFNNGDVIVSLLPLNSHCAWLTPATFKPELVPEELMASSLQLTVEDYVGSMQNLINDYRFNLYIIFYKRVMVIWVALGFVILLSLLFSGARGLPLFAGGIVWLIVNAFGVFFSMWIKCKLTRLLEQCIARINEIFYKNNILIGVDDKGKISCHKINLVFVYFDCTYCIKYLNDMIANEERSNQTSLPNLNHLRSDINATDIIVTGNTPTRYSQREKFGEKLLLRYSQRWIRDHNRSRSILTVPMYPDGSDFVPISPRHCPTSRCPCQYIEEHLKFKPLTKCSFKELFL